MRIYRWKLKTYIKDRWIDVEDKPVRNRSGKELPSASANMCQDYEERKQHLLDIIDDGGFQKLVVFNGWIGFLAGAYQVCPQCQMPSFCADGARYTPWR